MSPAGATDRSALPISADGVSAKGAVSDFVDPIGYDVVDTGRLADSGRPQPGTPVYATRYGSIDNEHGVPAGSEAISAAIGAPTHQL